MRKQADSMPVLGNDGWAIYLIIGCALLGVLLGVWWAYPDGFSLRGWLLETADRPGFWATMQGAPQPPATEADLLPAAIVVGGAAGVVAGVILAVAIGLYRWRRYQRRYAAWEAAYTAAFAASEVGQAARLAQELADLQKALAIRGRIQELAQQKAEAQRQLSGGG